VELPPRVAFGQRTLGTHLDRSEQSQLRPWAGRVGPVGEVSVQGGVGGLDPVADVVVGGRRQSL